MSDRPLSDNQIMRDKKYQIELKHNSEMVAFDIGVPQTVSGWDWDEMAHVYRETWTVEKVCTGAEGEAGSEI